MVDFAKGVYFRRDSLVNFNGNWFAHQRSSCLLMLFLIWLAGCAGTEVREDAVRTVVIQPGSEKATGRDDRYMLAGRLSVHNMQQRFSVTINWRHRANEDQIHLFSPLGQSIARIERDVTGVRLVTAEPILYQAENVEQLTQRVLGWVLPLSGLHFWIRGVHFPLTIAELDLDRSGRIVAIRQDGWRIRYSAFFPAQVGVLELPKLLELDRDNLKIKLIIDRWLDFND